jgi:DNA-binding NarL/FixJ family response regulator
MDSTSSQRCRLFIVDNNEDLAWSLSEVLALEPDLEPVGYWDRGADALRKAQEARADVLILDFRLPDCTALKLLDDARASAMPFAILVYSGYLSPEVAAAVLSKGAAGYITKGGSVDALVQEIRRAYRALPNEARAAATGANSGGVV